MSNFNQNKRIAVIGSVLSKKINLPTLFMDEVASPLSEHFTVDLFCPQRNIFKNKIDVNKGEVYNIHYFPIALKNKNYSLIIYHLDNSAESFLVKLFALRYPGIVILHDSSYFKLEVRSLTHGTDSYELNSLVNNIYGDSSIKIGDQYINGRSLEVYSDIYSFVEPIHEYSISLVSFQDLNLKIKNNTKIYRIDRPLIRTKEKVKYSNKKLNNSKVKKILVQLESPNSLSALRFIKEFLYPVPYKNFPYFYMIDYDSNSNEVLNINFIEKDFSLDVFNELDAFMLLGNRPSMGISINFIIAIFNNLPVSCEKNGEYLNINSSNINSNIFEGKFANLIKMILDDSKDHKNLQNKKSKNILDPNQYFYEQIFPILNDAIDISSNRLSNLKLETKFNIDKILATYHNTWRKASDCFSSADENPNNALNDYFNNSDELFL